MSEHADHNDEEVKKRRLLKIGVWVFSVGLLVVWIISLRFSVGSSVLPATEDDANSWQSEFSDTISIIRQSLDEASKGSVASSTETSEQGKEFIEELKNDVENIKPNDETASTSPEIILDDLEKRLGASSSPAIIPEVNTSKTSCPEYINCMPTIGEARPCLIPPGCENYTQIAY